MRGCNRTVFTRVSRNSVMHTTHLTPVDFVVTRLGLQRLCVRLLCGIATWHCYFAFRQIQKFGLRFPSIYEAQSFINNLKVNPLMVITDHNICMTKKDKERGPRLWLVMPSFPSKYLYFVPFPGYPERYEGTRTYNYWFWIWNFITVWVYVIKQALPQVKSFERLV